MTWKYTDYISFAFAFFFFSFLAVHYAHMKGPSQARGIASHGIPTAIVKPIYDASFKL